MVGCPLLYLYLDTFSVASSWTGPFSYMPIEIYFVSR
jgi:hypothetical protein